MARRNAAAARFAFARWRKNSGGARAQRAPTARNRGQTAHTMRADAAHATRASGVLCAVRRARVCMRARR
jgi:hypothetical protein